MLVVCMTLIVMAGILEFLKAIGALPNVLAGRWLIVTSAIIFGASIVSNLYFVQLHSVEIWIDEGGHPRLSTEDFGASIEYSLSAGDGGGAGFQPYRDDEEIQIDYDPTTIRYRSRFWLATSDTQSTVLHVDPQGHVYFDGGPVVPTKVLKSGNEDADSTMDPKPTVSVTPSSINVEVGSKKKVAVTADGTLPDNYSFSLSANGSHSEAEWGDDWSGNTTHLVISGTSSGKDTYDIKLLDNTSSKSEAVSTAKLTVTVTKKHEAEYPPNFSEATASSTRPSETIDGVRYDYSASSVLNTDTNAAWNEGKDGTGVGEWIRISSSSLQKVSGLRMLPGYAYSKSRYLHNHRPKKLKVELSDGYTTHWTLVDTPCQWQELKFGNSHDTKYVKLTIEDVYLSDGRYDDTCITEIRAF